MFRLSVVAIILLVTGAGCEFGTEYAGRGGAHPSTQQTRSAIEPALAQLESTIPPNCAEGWYEGHRYLVCQGSKLFTEAVTACGDFGMNLAHIGTSAENVWVINTALFAYGCTSWQQTSYWIANLRSQTEEFWPKGNRIWAPLEPSGDGNNVHILRYCEEPFGWNDVPPGHALGWVCESD